MYEAITGERKEGKQRRSVSEGGNATKRTRRTDAVGRRERKKNGGGGKGGREEIERLFVGLLQDWKQAKATRQRRETEELEPRL